MRRCTLPPRIARSEDLLFTNPAVVERVQDFLGLSRLRLERLQIYPCEGNAAINQSTRNRLREHFRPHNQAAGRVSWNRVQMGNLAA